MSRHRLLYWALVILLLYASVPPSVTAATPPCLYTEDQVCLSAPLPAGQMPTLTATKSTSASKVPEVLVKRKNSVSANSFATELQTQGFAQAKGLLASGWWRVPVPEGQTSTEVLARLKALPDVAAVEEDKLVKGSFAPNDPYFPLQWGLQKVQAPAAWEKTLGNTGVWIAVVDSGIDYYHPDAPTNLLFGYNFAYGNNNVFDDNGHGTHVAGIAAAATNNEIGVAGMCPSCGVLVVKVLDSTSSGSNSDVADGIEYAAYWGAYYGKRTIINLSLGSPYYSQAVADAVSYAQGLGALVVAAAGNNGPGAPSYPAALSGVVAVSATDANDQPASFSQYGNVAAPGVNIFSTVSPVGSVCYGDLYCYLEGTSMASPHVSGAAGLVWSAFPGCTATQVASELESTTDLPAGWSYSYGSGRLDARSAILSLNSGTLPDAAVGSSYLYAVPFSTLGGAGLRTFAVVAGNLPPGITLYSYSGTFAGTPTQAGVYNFTVRVTDGICEAATSIFTLNVQSPATPTPTTTLSPTPTNTPTITATATETSTPTPTATPALGNHVFLPFVPSDCVDCG
jgi:thermitase